MDGPRAAIPTLDTSGRVAGDVGGLAVWYEYDDLSPFTQGYIEALFASGIAPSSSGVDPSLRRDAFSDLSPEALAVILRDCERYEESEIAELRNAAEGRWFWHARNLRDDLKDFPPLTPYLGDDGKVGLR